MWKSLTKLTSSQVVRRCQYRRPLQNLSLLVINRLISAAPSDSSLHFVYLPPLWLAELSEEGPQSTLSPKKWAVTLAERTIGEPVDLAAVATDATKMNSSFDFSVDEIRPRNVSEKWKTVKSNKKLGYKDKKL
ncbi:hypothetical protein J6590_100553 [Homalodisca vitripennis]|nr:hypothetical protein J6590_100553 [Homalodisca vitripennis]